MDEEGFFYVLKKIFEIENIAIGDSGTLYIDQSKEFIEITEFFPYLE